MVILNQEIGQRLKIFNQWLLLKEKISSLAAIVKNNPEEEKISKEEIENWIKEVKVLHTELTHVASSTLGLILKEEILPSPGQVTECPYCKSSIPIGNNSPEACENPICPENKY